MYGADMWACFLFKRSCHFHIRVDVHVVLEIGIDILSVVYHLIIPFLPKWMLFLNSILFDGNIKDGFCQNLVCLNLCVVLVLGMLNNCTINNYHLLSMHHLTLDVWCLF